MYDIKHGSKFKKSFKRISRSGLFDEAAFTDIVSFLSVGKELPNKYHDHMLRGNFFGMRECHIAGDCLLVYVIDHSEKFVRLVDIGNHANLFE